MALRNTVKKSLQQLSKAINGDAKTEPQTLFKVPIFVCSACSKYNQVHHAVRVTLGQLAANTTPD